MINNKKGSVWIWILIILIIIAIAVGIYFLVVGTGNDGGVLFSGGSSIPQPPALPD